MAAKIHKSQMKVNIEVEVLIAIDMVKAEKNTDDTGPLLKMLLLESPTFSQKYEEIMKLTGKSA